MTADSLANSLSSKDYTNSGKPFVNITTIKLENLLTLLMECG